jgi:hypothetical protein
MHCVQCSSPCSLCTLCVALPCVRSAILNALLTLLNERLFDNGNQRLPVPLLCLVGASNELPESEELDALYDRFLIRRTVAQVSHLTKGAIKWRLPCSVAASLFQMVAFSAGCQMHACMPGSLYMNAFCGRWPHCLSCSACSICT